MACTTVVKKLITFASSLFDLGSDFINSLDFLGYNMSGKISSLVLDSFSSSIGEVDNLTMPDQNITTNPSLIALLDGRNNTKMDEMQEIHHFWGILGISIMFLPGIIIQFPFMLKFFKDNGCSCRYWKEIPIRFFGFLIYPITLIVTQIMSLCCSVEDRYIGDLYMSNSMEKWALGLVAMEAFFESAAQMVLQGFTIIYGYQVTAIQGVTIAASFILLAKMSIEFDILMTEKELSCKGTLMHTIQTLPCYATTITFRIASLILTFSYLRYWAIIPTFILITVLAGLSWIRYEDESYYERFTHAYFLTLSNVGVLNAYSASTIETGADTDTDKTSRFVRISSVVAFMHHSAVLASIIILSFYDEKYFYQEQFKNVILKPDTRDFYWVIAVVLIIGFYGLLLSLAMARRIVDIEIKHEKTNTGNEVLEF